MSVQKKHTITFCILILLLVLTAIINLSLGSVSIPLKTAFNAFFSKTNLEHSHHYIIINYRLPKTITAILVGSGLSISGLLMQTLFKNPLAGPFVLGITSGASLGVALIIMGASFFGGVFAALFLSKWAIVIGASIGSFLVLLCVIIMAARVRDTMAILIIGLMFGSLSGAIVSVLSYFSTAEQLQQYIFWGFGSLGDLQWNELKLFFGIYIIALILCVFCLKPLNALLLGENYAKSLGVNIKQNRYLVILTTSLLAGSITAFAGPIAFIGIAIPHIARQLFKTANHNILIPSVVLLGAIVMLICDTIAQLPYSNYTLPINAITALFGAPIVIWLLIKKRGIVF